MFYISKKSMDQRYNHKEIEAKWQKRWDAQDLHRAHDTSKKQKKYLLDMFPYPSSAGLHVGHPEGYTATDIVTRYLVMTGHEVLHPMGWDAFGLPAENYAIKTGAHPKKTTEDNIVNFRRQIKSFGFWIDWEREVNTSAPEYYKWTQWFFLLLYKRGLAYRKEAAVNWCESCKTVLANEQVVNGACERCKNPVVQKQLKQWFFRITDYAEKLLQGLDTIDWPEPIKRMQRNWIGKSEGATIPFHVMQSTDFVRSRDSQSSRMGIVGTVEVFTTRPDTLFGATYVVLAPEHGAVDVLHEHITNWSEVRRYRERAASKTDLERTDLAKEKTGVELQGLKAVNPANGEVLPIFIADYVLATYGTGSIMAVPAHDERDYAFSKKYHLPVREVIAASEPQESQCYTGAGTMKNSGKFDGMESAQAKWVITTFVKGKKTVQYRFRDWLISRQRYWGAPIPIIYCDVCGEVPVPEKNLPVELPTDVDFLPTGESPLTQSKKFHDVACPSCGKPARRESDTLDTFVCSSWYYFRYADARNPRAFASKKKMAEWLPVDLYVGGAEHAVLHLLYARFFTKVLQDAGYVDFDEPFMKLKNQGMILADDGQKMSKSLGNVVNPDEVVAEYGADTMRMYEMFMGPFEDAKPWNTKGILGVRRFLDKVWQLREKINIPTSDVRGTADVPTLQADLIRLLHQTIKKVTEDIVHFRFNTSVSALMILANAFAKEKHITRKSYKEFLKLLAPFAPHLAEELWERVDQSANPLHPKGSRSRDMESIFKHPWPSYDEKLIAEDEKEIVVQINGKVRARFTAPADASDTDLQQQAFAHEIVQKWLAGNTPKKVFVAKGKLVSMVI